MHWTPDPSDIIEQLNQTERFEFLAEQMRTHLSDDAVLIVLKYSKK